MEFWVYKNTVNYKLRISDKSVDVDPRSITLDEKA